MTPNDPAHIHLTLLQHADSAFPSGAVSFSWGLEALVNRGLVISAEDLRDFMATQITNRWANMDRAMLVHAHDTGMNLNRLAWLDALIDAQTLSAEQRQGSRQMGAAMVQMHRELATDHAEALAEALSNGTLRGHLPLVQGVLWRALGMDAVQAQTAAAHGLCATLLSAAVRLSVIGHRGAQKIHSTLLPVMTDILHQPVPDPQQVHGFTPQIEIASMMHETDEMRLFVN